VQVDVVDDLSGLGITVHDQPIAPLVDSLVSGYHARYLEEAAHEGVVTGLQVKGGGDVPSRYDQHVYRGLRGDVLEGHRIVVLIDYPGGLLPRGYPAEYAIFHGRLTSIRTNKKIIAFVFPSKTIPNKLNSIKDSRLLTLPINEKNLNPPQCTKRLARTDCGWIAGAPDSYSISEEA
jgi:hypothetical protein